MSDEFWLGLLLSIPIGLAVNLGSPFVARRMEGRSEAVARRREAEREEFRQIADNLAGDQSAYYTYLLTAVLRTTYIGALFGLMGGLLAALGQAANTVNIFFVSSSLFLGAQVVALLAAILILNVARGALSMIKEVQLIRTTNRS